MSLLIYEQFTLTCDRCSKQRTYGQTRGRYGEAVKMEYPDGWVRVAGNTDICPEHSIVIRDKADGSEDVFSCCGDGMGDHV